METFEIYCGGEFLAAGREHMVTDKFTGLDFARTFLANQQLLDRAITAAQQAQAQLAALSSMEKYDFLMQIASKLAGSREQLARLLATESGKPLIYARAEIDRAAHTFIIAAEASKRLPREYSSLDWTSNGKNKEALVRYFPVGIVAGISPFNFPMNLAVHKIAPALAAGCPIVLKPASATPLSTLSLARIIAETGFPRGSVSIIPMDRETGNRLVTDPRLSLLSFTGSPEVGWKLKEQSGKKKVVLELGGNAGVIITESAKLPEIINKCVAGAFAYSGQICIHAQRFYVHPQHFEKFCSMMTEEAGRLVYGDPVDPGTQISVMIDEENVMRVGKWVREAVDAGAQLLCGGRVKGRYYEPTILTGTTPSMRVNCEEVFGPVVCIEKYDGSIEDAVKKINDSRFGLQCGVFTDSVKETDYAFGHLEVGGVILNDVPTLRFDQMPYGGIKDSGLGREGVEYAMRDMLEAKVLVK